MASPGIEPGSGASETLILSIVLQGQKSDKAAKITEPDYYCFNSLNIRSVSSFLHSSVPGLSVAAVPAATP